MLIFNRMLPQQILIIKQPRLGELIFISIQLLQSFPIDHNPVLSGCCIVPPPQWRLLLIKNARENYSNHEFYYSRKENLLALSSQFRRGIHLKMKKIHIFKNSQINSDKFSSYNAVNGILTQYNSGNPVTMHIRSSI